jgi:basic membrane protein A
MKNKKVIAIVAVFGVLIAIACFNLNNFKLIFTEIRKDNLSVGLLISDDCEETYSTQQLSVFNEMCEYFDLKDDQIHISLDVQGEQAYLTIINMLENECDLIWGIGDSIKDYIIQAATEYRDTQFCIPETDENLKYQLENLHSYSVKKHEAKYISGVIAGTKIEDLIQNGEVSSDIKIGYIADSLSAEDISNYTAFYLGVKSIVPKFDMLVKAIDAEGAEYESRAAKALIANGCIIIAHHNDSEELVNICEENNVYFIGEGDVPLTSTSNYVVTETKYNWKGSYIYAIEQLINRNVLSTQWTKRFDSNVGELIKINENAFADSKNYDLAKELIIKANEEFISGKRFVFDTANWKVNGETIASTLTDELKADYGGVEYIDNGRFMEYELTTLPKFAFKIDEIEILI